MSAMTLVQRINAMSDNLMAVQGDECDCLEMFGALSQLERGMRAAEEAVTRHELRKVVPGLAAILWNSSSHFGDEGQIYNTLDQVQFLDDNDEVLFTMGPDAEIDLDEAYSANFFRTLFSLPADADGEEAEEGAANELTDEEFDALNELEAFGTLREYAWNLADRLCYYEVHHDSEESGRIEINPAANLPFDVLVGRIMHNVACDEPAKRDEIRELLSVGCQVLRLNKQHKTLGESATLRDCLSLDAIVTMARPRVAKRDSFKGLFVYLDSIGADVVASEQTGEVYEAHGCLRAYLDHAIDKVEAA